MIEQSIRVEGTVNASTISMTEHRMFRRGPIARRNQRKNATARRTDLAQRKLGSRGQPTTNVFMEY